MILGVLLAASRASAQRLDVVEADDASAARVEIGRAAVTARERGDTKTAALLEARAELLSIPMPSRLLALADNDLALGDLGGASAKLQRAQQLGVDVSRRLRAVDAIARGQVTSDDIGAVIEAADAASGATSRGILEVALRLARDANDPRAASLADRLGELSAQAMKAFEIRLDASFEYLSYFLSPSFGSAGIKAPPGYTGNKLQFDVRPIMLGELRGSVGFTRKDVPNFALAGLRYQTSRVFGSGGTIDSSTALARELGVGSLASDLVAAAARYSGFTLNGTYANFTAGTARLTSWNGNTTVDSTPIRVQYARIDAGWDFFGTDGCPCALGEHSLFLGLRYLRLDAPTIVYEIEKTNAQGDAVITGETPPQHATLREYVVGGRYAGHAHPAKWNGWGVLASIGLFFGGGQMSIDKPVAELTPSPGANLKPTSCGTYWMDFELGGGLSYELTKADAPFHLSIIGEGTMRGMAGACASTYKVQKTSATGPVEAERALTSGDSHWFTGLKGSIGARF